MRVTLGLFIAAFCGISPAVRAVCQEGCLSSNNTALGENALALDTTGAANTAIGSGALLNNTTGSSNTASGYDALVFNTSGSANTATGYSALFRNQTGGGNTATGSGALQNDTASYNTANGYQALYSNTTATFNTANGYQALYGNTTGTDNTATGALALVVNSSGSYNTASGFNALYYNTTGSNNVANGYRTLFYNTIGNNNIAEGFNALQNNTTGSSNVAVGESAGINLTTGSSNIDIGNKGVVGEANTIRVGKSGTQTATFIAGITGTTVAGGVGVLIGSNGRLGTINSSARYKENIQPMDKASETILALKPVMFRYKEELDPEGIPQFGLVAEEVEKVNPDLVARDEDGKPYTVRYEAVNAMLLNEFLKEHQKVQRLEAALAAVNERLKKQDAKIDKVNAKVELTKPAPCLVTNE